MGWPFSKRPTPSPGAPENAIFERLRSFMSDENAQIAQYPDSLKLLISAGSDADQTPDGYGYFGTSVTNPIPVNGPIGEVLYLSALRVQGKRLLFHRLKSIDKIDAFECVAIDGNYWDILYLDMYHPRKSKRAPNGYAIRPENVLLSGVTGEVPDFPQSLYPSIVSYSEKRFGISIADPEIRMTLETTKFTRPLSHSRKLKLVLNDSSASIDENDIVQELVNEATGSQIVLFNQLQKLAKLEGHFAPDKVLPEIIYFVLAVTTHAIFSSGTFKNPSATADKICLQVLRINLESCGIQSNLAGAVNEYQNRFLLYRDAMPSLADDQSRFGLVVSKRIYGKESPLAGTVLSAATLVILDELKKIIEEF